MKITNLAIIFVIIAIPFLLVTYLKMGDMKCASMKTLEINRILDTATEDGASALVESGSNNKIVINKERAVQTFFNSLYVNLNILDNSVLQRKITGYIPAIVIIDYDGYYVVSQESYTGADGHKEVKLVWSPKKMFSYADSNYVYTLTLDNQVTVYDAANKDFLKGDYNDLKSKISSNLIQDDVLFDQIRRKTIIESIKNDINYCINKHNDIALKYGITYHFSLPTISNEDWYRTVNDVGLLAFFQGVPVGTSGERFNSFALGGARIVKAQKYYIDTDAATGIKHYHKENCSVLTSRDTILNNRKECAQKGYLPCPICNP